MLLLQLDSLQVVLLAAAASGACCALRLLVVLCAAAAALPDASVAAVAALPPLLPPPPPLVLPTPLSLLPYLQDKQRVNIVACAQPVALAACAHCAHPL
jgi:hypothetical protein